MIADRPEQTARSAQPIGVAVVADRDVTRGALLGLVGEDPELVMIGSAVTPLEGDVLLDLASLRVILVSLSLAESRAPSPGVAFIRRVKATPRRRRALAQTGRR